MNSDITYPLWFFLFPLFYKFQIGLCKIEQGWKNYSIAHQAFKILTGLDLSMISTQLMLNQSLASISMQFTGQLFSYVLHLPTRQGLRWNGDFSHPIPIA